MPLRLKSGGESADLTLDLETAKREHRGRCTVQIRVAVAILGQALCFTSRRFGPGTFRSPSERDPEYLAHPSSKMQLRDCTAVACLAALATLAVGQSTNMTKPKPFGFFGDNAIYWPPTNLTIFYPRITELSDGTILATAGLNTNPGIFPIFSSSDGGASWEWISNMTDQKNGLGMNAQPALAELTFDVGSFPKGTVLASGNSWSSTKNSTNIDVYASKDKGKTWEFVSNVAKGSGPSTRNGNPCIWEPYIL